MNPTAERPKATIKALRGMTRDEAYRLTPHFIEPPKRGDYIEITYHDGSPSDHGLVVEVDTGLGTFIVSPNVNRAVSMPYACVRFYSWRKIAPPADFKGVSTIGPYGYGKQMRERFPFKMSIREARNLKALINGETA